MFLQPYTLILADLRLAIAIILTIPARALHGTEY